MDTIRKESDRGYESKGIWLVLELDTSTDSYDVRNAAVRDNREAAIQVVFENIIDDEDYANKSVSAIRDVLETDQCTSYLFDFNEQTPEYIYKIISLEIGHVL